MFSERENPGIIYQLLYGLPSNHCLIQFHSELVYSRSELVRINIHS